MSNNGVVTNIMPDSLDIDVCKQLSLLATNIALQNFEWRYVTLVFFNSTILYGVQVFLQSYQKIVIAANGTFYPKFVKTTRQYVLFENTVANLDNTLDWMQSHEFDNTGKFIVLCQTEECDENEAIPLFWNYRITNVIFLKSVEQQVLGYTYFPLNDSRCISNTPTKLDLKHCAENADSDQCNFFTPKLNNMNTCELIASTFNQTPYMKIVDGIPTGSDGDLLLLIAEHLNATLKIVTPHIGSGWGILEKNGSWTGSLADLYYDLANLSMTSAALTTSRYECFQISTDYNTVSIVWISHPADLLPSSLKLTHPFQPSAQLALALSFVLIVMCSFIMRTRYWLVHCRPINVSRPSSSVLFYSWAIFMGLPTPKLPRKTALLFIVLLWMWFGLLMRTFYQVSLITVLKANYYFANYETIEEAIDDDCSFGGGPSLKEYFIDHPLIYDNWINIKTPDIMPTIRNISHGFEFVIAMNMETAKLIAWREKLHVHMLPRKIAVSPTAIFFKKYSPLVSPVDRALVRLLESGFVSKLYKNYASQSVKPKTSTSNEPLNTQHYTGCYAVLISGWMVSFLFFALEFVYFKLYRR